MECFYLIKNNFVFIWKGRKIIFGNFSYIELIFDFWLFFRIYFLYCYVEFCKFISLELNFDFIFFYYIVKNKILDDRYFLDFFYVIVLWI